HDRDIVTLSFIGEVPYEAIHLLLRILTLETSERRAQGGPAAIWAKEGDPSVAIEQIDYKSLLAREEGDVPEPARRDDLWRSIVLSISSGGGVVFDEAAQQRLLAIAGSPVDIGDLATAAAAPKCSADGSPMITSQAATVLAAVRHLKSIVSVMDPGRMPQVEQVPPAVVVDGRTARVVQRQAVHVGRVPRLARRRRQPRGTNGGDGSAARASGMDRKPGSGQRPPAVGADADRSVHDREECGARVGNRDRHGSARRRPPDVGRLRRRAAGRAGGAEARRDQGRDRPG